MKRKDTLVIHTAFRSVTIKDLGFEKDATLLSETVAEPNRQNAIMFTPAGFNEVQSLILDNLDIVNCHRSFTIGYAKGNLYEGLIKEVRVTNCRFTSPYGSCDSNIPASLGGGQMTYMNAWVDTAYYMNNYFSGGTDNHEAVDYSWLDGSHFGSPHQLVFVGNIAENFDVEAVFHTGYEVVLGTSFESLVVPASNGVDTVDIVLPSNGQNDHFTLGDDITLYDDQTTLAVFEIVGWDKPTETLTVVNNGWKHNPAPGTTIPASAAGRINLSNGYTDMALATITGNYINSRYQAVVSQNTALVSGNTIEGLDGVVVKPELSHTHMMRASGSVISGNRIDLRRPGNSVVAGIAKGVQAQQPDAVIWDNIITSGLTNRVAAISADSRGTAVLDNKLMMLNPVDNSPVTYYRCVGIQVSSQFTPIRGGTVTNVVVSGNFTEGFDLAVGATIWNGDVDIFCPVHYSTNDAMIFDLGNSLLHFTREN